MKSGEAAERKPGSLRVLHVVPAGPNGVTSTYTQRDIDRLGRSGVESRVLFFAGSSMLRRPDQLVGGIRAIRREIRAFRPQVVHAHWGSLLGFASASAAIGGPPLVVGYHGSDINPVPAESRARSLFRLACSQLAALGADAIICVSEELRGRLWFGRSRARVILSGINLDRFIPGDRAEARRRLRWPADEPVVLFNAGNGKRVKRLDLAEASIAHARRSLGRLRFEVMRGDVPCDEVPVRLNAADCLLVTSDFEGSPNIVREALACRTPVVSVPVGDVRKWLDGLAGTKVVERDPVLLGQAIVDAVTSGIRPALDGRTAKFSDQSSCRAVLEVYESLVVARGIRC